MKSNVRPGNLGVKANIVFFYYKDLIAAQQFYENILGLEMFVDQGVTKIYQVSSSTFVGLVDERYGTHRTSETKPVILAFVTDQIDEWYEYLVSKGVKMRSPIRDSTGSSHLGFMAYDPEGYLLEFEKFNEHPENVKLLELLKKSRERKV